MSATETTQGERGVAPEWCDAEQRARFEANIEAMRTHQPAVADVIEARLRTGEPCGCTIKDALVRAVDGNNARTPGGEGVETRLREMLAQSEPAFIGGIGDGGLLAFIADRPVRENGATEAVYLCEDDPDRMIAAMAAQDLTGPEGPIQSEHVEWFVGAEWARALLDRMKQRPMLPMPSINVRLGMHAPPAEQAWAAVRAAREVSRRDGLLGARAWAVSRRAGELAEVLSGSGRRAPRVLLFVSRFTSVLRHSMTDMARALESMGWQVRLEIEAMDHERIDASLIAGAIASFEPDLLITIDHHRQEFPELPQGLPFVCWIQDDLPNLIEAGVGDRLGPRDFAVGAWAHRYQIEWGYPAERCIVIPRMTAVEAPGRPRSEPTDDMVYVSNHSAEPRKVVHGLSVLFGDQGARSRAILDAADAMVSRYESGGSFVLPSEIRDCLLLHAGQVGMENPEESWVRQVSELLSLKLNNCLFRQQGLAWASKAAEQRGLRLGIYGSGWEAHPSFAAHARGTISYGDALCDLTARTPMSLRLESYPPMSHQRLIDGCAAGGFFLNRRMGPWEQADYAFGAFFLEYLAGRAADHSGALSILDAGRADELERLTRAVHESTPRLAGQDVVSWYESRRVQGSLADFQHSLPPPGYFETTFGSETELGLLIDRFLDPAERSRLEAVQRAFVSRRHSYQSGLTHLIGEIVTRLRAEAKARDRSAA